MNISVIGAGYVGLVTGVCLAYVGNKVICVDIDEEKISALKNGIIPIYERDLDYYLKESYNRGNICFTTDIKFALESSDICFIAVGTPTEEISGKSDLSYVVDVSKSIGRYIDHHMYIISKSTIPVGTSSKIKDIISYEIKKRVDEFNNSSKHDQGSLLNPSNITFDIISNPEFLKEGDAVNDFMKPDRIVVGVENDKSFSIIKRIYAPFNKSNNKLIKMDLKSSEMTKYVSNAMLATKISFINEMANICEKIGADINFVRVGIGSDKRIGYDFIYPGCGYGGSCFPKDIKALIETSKEFDYYPKLLQSVEDVNKAQKIVIATKVTKYFLKKQKYRVNLGKPLEGLSFAIWGLSFKPETDDMRDASSIEIIKELISKGAKVKVYDPKAMKIAKEGYLKELREDISYKNTKLEVLKGSDALLLVTEWKEFESPDFSTIKRLLKNPVIFDGRNQYDREILKNIGFEYFQIGVKD